MLIRFYFFTGNDCTLLHLDMSYTVMSFLFYFLNILGTMHGTLIGHEAPILSCQI